MAPIISLLDCEYFPCVDWYVAFYNAEKIHLEQWEYFQRTSFRNRCEVTGPNGAITLSVPLEKGRNQRTLMKDTLVCNKEKWQQLHWKTLCASYRRAPYFEYYEEKFAHFFTRPFRFLIDLNLESIHLINQLLKIQKEFILTEKFEKNDNRQLLDFRKSFSPKTPTQNPQIHYLQNFEERHGFLPNLSMLDMLFSCGNKSHEKF